MNRNTTKALRSTPTLPPAPTLEDFQELLRGIVGLSREVCLTVYDGPSTARYLRDKAPLLASALLLLADQLHEELDKL